MKILFSNRELMWLESLLTSEVASTEVPIFNKECFKALKSALNKLRKELKKRRMILDVLNLNKVKE